MTRGIVAAVFAAVGAAGVPPAAGALEHLPNVSPSPPGSIRVGVADEGIGRALRFSTTTANAGGHALELLGGAPSEDLQRADALQCVTFAGRVCVLRERVGEFVWHPQHGHWHLDGYARYELRALDDAGLPVPGPDGLVAGGQKVSFCLLDYERAGPPAPIYENPPLYAGCTGVLQGISPGWADTYEASLDGQQIELAGVPDGDYALVITIDPDGLLRQTTRADDTSFRRIRIRNGGTGVTVLE